MILLPIVISWVSIQGHRSLVQILPEPMRNFWEKWELSALVVISLVSQLILLVLANRRSYRKDIWIRVIVWSAYMIADWVPTFAMGVISNIVGDYYKISKCEKKAREKGAIPSFECHKKNVNPQLIAFWAPFFIIHLGGPHTITAYALEDHQLWLRHSVSLLSQSLLTSYIILQSWKNSLSDYLSCLMLSIGFLKYKDRISCLYSGRISHLRDSLLVTTEDHPGVLTPGVKKLLKEMGLFVSLSTDMVSNPTELRLNRAWFQQISHDDAFLRINNELKFTFDVVYTQKSLIDLRDKNVSTLAFSVTSTLTVLLLKILQTLVIECSARDRIITLVLLIHVLTSDCIAYSKTFEDINTDRVPRIWRYFTDILTGKHPLSMQDSLGRRNFLTSIWDEEENGCGNFLSSKVRKLKFLCSDIKNPCDVSDDLQQMIFNYYKNKSQCILSDILGRGYKDIILSKLRIQASLRILEFHKTIVAWHIATTLFFYSQQESNPEHYLLTETKKLSDYMLFLLMDRRYLLPVGAGLITMRHTLSNARELFPHIPKNSSEAEAANLLLGQLHTIAQTQSTHNESVLIEACRIAMQLRDRSSNGEEITEMLSDLWVEIVGYAAANCKADNHAQQLTKGGEFLTKVWLLQAHFGLSDQLHLIAFEDDPQIPLNSRAPESEDRSSTQITIGDQPLKVELSNAISSTSS